MEQQQQQQQYQQQPQYQVQQPQYQVQQPQMVIQQVPGACPHQVVREDFSLLGIALAIICFPVGIICCLVMKERRCAQCGMLLG